MVVDVLWLWLILGQELAKEQKKLKNYPGRLSMPRVTLVSLPNREMQEIKTPVPTVFSETMALGGEGAVWVIILEYLYLCHRLLQVFHFFLWL